MIATAIIALAMFFLGFYLRTLEDRVRGLIRLIPRPEPKHTDEGQSALVEPETPVQAAMRRQKEIMEKLNGQS